MKLSMHHRIANFILEFSIFFFSPTTNIRMENDTDTRREPLLTISLSLSLDSTTFNNQNKAGTLIERVNESLWERIMQVNVT